MLRRRGLSVSPRFLWECLTRNTTCQALTRYLRTGDPVAGSTDPWSAGNGSLMRLAPVALRFRHDRPRLLAAAADQSRTTHGAEEAVDACRAFGALLADAIAGSPFSDVLAPRRFTGAAAITQVIAGSWRGRTRDTIRSSGYVVHTLEAASGQSPAPETSAARCCSRPTWPTTPIR